MSTVSHTFLQRPDTLLKTVFKEEMANQRAEDTRIIQNSVLIDDPPTMFDDAATRIVGRRVEMPEPPEPRRIEKGNIVTVLEREVEDVRTRLEVAGPRDEESRKGTMVRKSLPEGVTVHKYQIESIIGEGGFGITYRALDKTINRRVAVKELFLQGNSYRTNENRVMSRHPNREDRVMQWAKFFFSEEARVTFALRHEGIVRIYDFFKTNNTAYIVYELLSGDDLFTWGEANRNQFRHGRILDLFRATCDALRHVHDRGYVHRDIKPANIFLISELTTPILIDFGAAATLGAPPEGGQIIVTPGYSPPEQYNPAAPQDARTDIYSLCATFYWLLSGQRPPDSMERVKADDLPPLREIVEPNFKVGERLYRVIEQGMSLRPEDRYNTVGQLLDDLIPKLSLPSTGYTPTPRGERIFVSYRRDDSAHFSGRLLDFLEMRFGSKAVFFDVQSIPAGTDFWDYIKEILSGCAVMLVVIGPRWLDILQRRRRRWYHIFKKKDYVAMEIQAAIEMELPIVPVLFDTAPMPKASQLPKFMRPIAMLNAAIIGSGREFRDGADGICDQIVRIKNIPESGLVGEPKVEDDVSGP